MARSKKTKPEEVEGFAVQPALRVDEGTPVYYVNHANVAHSAYEFSLTVGRLPTTPTPEAISLARETGVLLVDAELQLLIPPSMVPGLIQALTTQKEDFERQVGPITSVGA